MRLILVRHGETHHNRDGLGLGRADAELTERGRYQTRRAAEAAAAARPQRVYTSPLRRALEGGRLIAELCGAPLEVREELAEMDVGFTEGLPLEEIRQRFPDFVREWLGARPETVRMPGGESLDDVARRLRRWLADVRQREEETVAVVSHTFVLRVLLCLLLDLPLRRFRDFRCDLASVSEVEWNEGAVVRRWNDVCHLHG